jgi:hypothetical protein
MGKLKFASCGTGNTMKRDKNRKSMVYVCFFKADKTPSQCSCMCMCVNFNLPNAFAMQVM